MLSINRVLGLSIAVATSGLAVWAQAQAPIYGYFRARTLLGSEVPPPPATITISFKGSSAAANYDRSDPSGLFCAVFPADCPGPFTIRPNIHVDVATRGRHYTEELRGQVFPAPVGKHNELIIILDQITRDDCRLLLGVTQAPN